MDRCAPIDIRTGNIVTGARKYYPSHLIRGCVEELYVYQHFLAKWNIILSLTQQQNEYSLAECIPRIMKKHFGYEIKKKHYYQSTMKSCMS